MKSIVALSVLALITGALSFGCSAEPGTNEEIREQSAAVVGADTFLYFRSNASGWGADGNNRLLPFVGTNLFARAVNVTEPWMVTTGDNAIVTETNQLDGWGSAQTHRRASAGTMVAPDQDTLVVSNSNFTVQYQATGIHRVVVDVATSPFTIFVERATCPNCPSPTQCVINPNSIPTCLQ